MSTVRDILDRKDAQVACVEKEATVLAAAEKMNDRRIGALVVMEKDRVVGIFSERDILTRVVATGKDPHKLLVGEVMTAPVAFCRPDTTIEECWSVMTGRRIRHLPVVHDAKLIGIVTSGDLMAHEVRTHKRKIDDQAETIQFLNQYITGEYS
jgi:CBS domain-containing protein